MSKIMIVISLYCLGIVIMSLWDVLRSEDNKEELEEKLKDSVVPDFIIFGILAVLLMVTNVFWPVTLVKYPFKKSN